MKRSIIKTADGSTTIHIEDWDEQYHSKHGAIQEAYHVFIHSGLHHFLERNNTDSATILEIGFGTGLNAFITSLEAEKKGFSLHYIGVEGYPVSDEEVKQLNYVEELDATSFQQDFIQMHEVAWEEAHQISKGFKLIKRQQFFDEIEDENSCDLIYFDAFGARVQPELWTQAIFSKMFTALRENGVLVTYAAKGSVRRAMQEVGFEVERLPGPPGKREMLRATKLPS